ncbi:MAG: glutathione S-transferase family protein [Roseovarius sp.]
MKIYWIRAQAPRRVLAMARHLGLDFEPVELDPAAGEMTRDDYLSLNPNGKAPTLVDGDTVLFEASAIMAYFARKAGSDVWPADNWDEQIDVLKWLSWADSHWNPAVGPRYFEYVVKPTFLNASVDPEALTGTDDALRKYAGILDARMQGRDWIALDRLSIADFQAASMAAYWKVARMPLADFPNVLAWLERLEALPAWRSPWPHGLDMATEGGAPEGGSPEVAGDPVTAGE